MTWDPGGYSSLQDLNKLSSVCVKHHFEEIPLIISLNLDSPNLGFQQNKAT